MKKIFFILLAVFVLLTGCNENKESAASTKDVFAMDTYMNLKAYGKNSDIALDNSVNEITRLENILSVTNENSDLSRINNACGNAVSITDDTAKIIEKSLEISNLTDGCLDISVYPVLKEWGFTTGNYKIPDIEILENLLENVDYKQIKTAENIVTVPENYQLDLGALAKGYTSDKIMEILSQNGIKSAIISLGGNVQALGTKPDGSLWKVAVVNPFSPDTSMAVLEIYNKAVITSGNYERYFIGDDGKQYHHIIDTKTGYPAENELVSVTIIGDSGILCDALSTALFVAGFDKSVDLWQSRNDFEMILVTNNKKIFYTDAIADRFENLSNMSVEVISREQ